MTSHASVLADGFYSAALALGRVVDLLDDEVNRSQVLTDAVQAEPDDADFVVTRGIEVVESLKTLAMRLDRSVCVRHSRE